MIKVIAIGDVHGQWAEAWRALRVSMAADNLNNPSEALAEGRFQVIFIGDLVHYKDAQAYAQAVGTEPYKPDDPDHLRRAAKAQIRELYRFKDFVDKAKGNVTIILGNHDESALTHEYELTTRGGLKHFEFDESKGGTEIPDDLKAWMHGFAREKILYDVHFAHAGPLPGMQYFDDFFYHDPDTKGWWKNKPEIAQQSGYRFGVYGHTVMKDGILVDKENGFAMIDALSERQFFEMIVSEDRLDYRVIQF